MTPKAEVVQRSATLFVASLAGVCATGNTASAAVRALARRLGHDDFAVPRQAQRPRGPDFTVSPRKEQT